MNKDYKLLDVLTVDGKDLRAGSTVNLNEALADWLDGIGVISISGEVKAPKPDAQRIPQQRPVIRRGCCG